MRAAILAVLLLLSFTGCDDTSLDNFASPISSNSSGTTSGASTSSTNSAAGLLTTDPFAATIEAANAQGNVFDSSQVNGGDGSYDSSYLDPSLASQYDNCINSDSYLNFGATSSTSGTAGTGSTYDCTTSSVEPTFVLSVVADSYQYMDTCYQTVLNAVPPQNTQMDATSYNTLVSELFAQLTQCAQQVDTTLVNSIPVSSGVQTANGATVAAGLNELMSALQSGASH